MWQRQFTEARTEFISYSNFIVRMAAILPAKGSENWRCFWFVCACRGSYNQDSLTSSQSFCHDEEPGWFIDWQVQRGRQRQKKHELKLWWEMSVLSSLPSAERRPHGAARIQAWKQYLISKPQMPRVMAWINHTLILYLLHIKTFIFPF